MEEKRREEGKEEGGGRWALDCAAHQIKQILCKDSVVFLGVNFCGEGLWEKGRGEWHEIKQILCKDSIVFLEVIFGGYFLEDGGARVQDGGTDK